MEATYFAECNCDIAKNQKQYITLPSHISNEGKVTTCWKLTFKERLKLFFQGYLFLQILTFNKPLQPLKMIINKPELEG